MTSQLWILDEDKRPKSVNVVSWDEWFRKADRKVAHDEVDGVGVLARVRASSAE